MCRIKHVIALERFCIVTHIHVALFPIKTHFDEANVSSYLQTNIFA